MPYKITQLEPFGVLIEPNHGTQISDLNRHVLRELFLKNQIIVLRGFNGFQQPDDFVKYCESWGEASVWPFGKVLELVEHDDPQDHIFDNRYVPMHWDGMYRPHVPEYQIFHCISAPLPGFGGRTTFSNTLLALNNASSEHKALWTKVTGSYKRKMEFYDSQTVSPVVTKHPYRNFSVIRYNEAHLESKGAFLNPPDLNFSGIDSSLLEAFHSSLREALYDPKNFYAHEWQNGDVVISDNFSLLHGREAFRSKSPRHLQRVQIQSTPPFPNPGLRSYQ